MNMNFSISLSSYIILVLSTSISLTSCFIPLSSFTGRFSMEQTRKSKSKAKIEMKDYPKPNLEDTRNYRESEQLSNNLKTTLKSSNKKKVAIIGGGLSGLVCGKYLVDAGHEANVYEARNVLGGKVSAWKDKDG